MFSNMGELWGVMGIVMMVDMVIVMMGDMDIAMEERKMENAVRSCREFSFTSWQTPLEVLVSLSAPS